MNDNCLIVWFVRVFCFCSVFVVVLINICIMFIDFFCWFECGVNCWVILVVFGFVLGCLGVMYKVIVYIVGIVVDCWR